MSITSIYYQNVIKRDMLNKFLISNIKSIPNIEKIELSYNFDLYDYELLLSGASALKFLSNQTSFLIRAKTPNKQLRLKKGAPVGCKVSLRKTNLFLIFNKLIKKFVFWERSDLMITKLSNKNNTYFFKINNIFSFSDFTNCYFYFSDLSNVNVNFLFFMSNTKKAPHHTLFLIKSHNIQ